MTVRATKRPAHYDAGSVSLVLAIIIVILVGYLTVTHKDVGCRVTMVRSLPG